MKSKWMSELESCFRLALPLAAAQLAQSATGFVDTVMMGMLGSEVIAAGGLGATVFICLLLISTAIVSAVSPLVAEAFGSGRNATVQSVVRQGLWLALLLGIPVTLLLWNMAPILRVLGQEESVAVLAQVYLRAIAWGIVPGLLVGVLRSFVSALSQTRPVMVIVILGTALNVVGNYILMFGKFGFPKLGLAGIGYASAASFWGMLVALVIFILTNPVFQPYRIFHRLGQWEPAIFGSLVKIGIPIGVLAMVEAGLFTITTFLVGQLGTVALAAHQVAIQTAAITFTVPMGISLATTVQVGQRLGQRDFRGARISGFVGIGLSMAFMLVMAITIWTIPTTIVDLYLDIYEVSNTPVVMQAEGLLAVAAMFQLVDGIQVAATGALRGLQDTRVPMLVGILCYWGIGLSSGYWLGFHQHMGSVGLWWGLAIGLAGAALFLTWRFWRISRHHERQAIAQS
ncbi:MULTISPECIES: MATE family efflux transporter [unclassified Leptolyngbya]